MADHRMFSHTVISSDKFLDLPPTAQVLYFHIGLSADDDGFTDRVNSIRRQVGATADDLQKLVEAGYIYIFSSGAAVDMYWNVNNSIRKDRHKPTVHQEEFKQLTLVDGGKYILNTSDNQVSTECQPGDGQVVAQVSKKVSKISEVSKDNHPSVNNYSESTSKEPVDNSNAEPNPPKQQQPSLDGLDLYSLDNKQAFELFRKEYPRRQGTLRDVQTAWVNATIGDHILPGDLVMAARNYAARCTREKTEAKFIKMPQNFIKDGWREFIPKHLPSCPRCHGQGVYEGENGMIMCDCDRRYG